MQNASQQFLWFLVTKLEAIRKMRSTLDQGNLDFVYTDLAIQVLANESDNARAAALRIQPSTSSMT